jgi:hypothetical protein
MGREAVLPPTWHGLDFAHKDTGDVKWRSGLPGPSKTITRFDETQASYIRTLL